LVVFLLFPPLLKGSVKDNNYKSYFKYAYEMKEGMEYERLPSTRKRKLKNYKE
jgi:hypothetical protein